MSRVAPSRTRHLAPGDKLGDYEVIRQIAIGGMAELYLARTNGLERFEKLVVIKRILPQYVGHAAFVEMFLNEARLAATLHHVNIAQVHDIGGTDGDYFFAMEYVHGEDLDRIAMAAEEQGVPVSLDAALTLVAGLCAGLHYAHERTDGNGTPMGVVHRDVSPSNVLVSYDGAVKLVDFGIARTASWPGNTQGGLKGKIAYMSPEQCRGKAQLDRRSDLYSVGTILYELTAGRPPFTGETEYQILHQIVNEDAPPPSTLVPGYPPHLERIVLRALARDPDQRYATAHALQSDIEEFAHESRLRISPLVLARLMGTLFGERGQMFGVDDEKTILGDPPEPELTESAVGAEPITAFEPAARAASVPGQASSQRAAFGRSDLATSPLPRAPESPPGAATVAVPASPEPSRPNPYPVVTELMTATPGALVTAAGKYGGLPTSEAGRRADPTDRVRTPPRGRAASPTAFVRARSRVPLFVIAASLLAGASLAAVIALRPGQSSPPAPTSAAPSRQRMPVVPVAPPEVAPAPAAPVPVEPARAVVEEAPVPAPQAQKPVVKKPAAMKPKPRPQPKSSRQPLPKKEPTWSADSPFMPVRPKK